MAIERTLSIIKPDAVTKNVIGQIYSRFEGAGLKIIAARMMHLSRAEAEGFYAVHRERPFFKDLVDFMISGPVMVQALDFLAVCAGGWLAYQLRFSKEFNFVEMQPNDELLVLGLAVFSGLFFGKNSPYQHRQNAGH